MHPRSPPSLSLPEPVRHGTKRPDSAVAPRKIPRQLDAELSETMNFVVRLLPNGYSVVRSLLPIRTNTRLRAIELLKKHRCCPLSSALEVDASFELDGLAAGLRRHSDFTTALKDRIRCFNSRFSATIARAPPEFNFSIYNRSKYIS